MFKSDMAMTKCDEALLELGRRLRDSGYRFTTVSPETHRRVNARPENRLATCVTEIFGWSRPFRRGMLPGPLFGLMEAADLLVRGDEAWHSRVRLSTLDDLLLFHSAYPTLAADSVFFGPDTYRFAAALKTCLDELAGVERAVDIGCGSGAGGLLVGRHRPDASVALGDINHHALRFARINAALNGVRNVAIRQSDLLRDIEGRFDLVIANPPYLNDPGKRAYRHGGGALGADLSLAIVEAAIERLTPGGTLLLYTGSAIVGGHDAFLAAAAAALDRADMRRSYREMDPDVFGEELDTPAYAQADRIAAVVLTAVKPR
jgi:methylase of polypeptide subunit release factors